MPACKQGYVYVGCSPAFLLPSAPNNTEKHSKKAILFLPSFCAPKVVRVSPVLRYKKRGMGCCFKLAFSDDADSMRVLWKISGLT